MIGMKKVINIVSCVQAIKGRLSVIKSGNTFEELALIINYSRFQTQRALNYMLKKNQIKKHPYWSDSIQYTRKYILTQE